MSWSTRKINEGLFTDPVTTTENDGLFTDSIGDVISDGSFSDDLYVILVYIDDLGNEHSYGYSILSIQGFDGTDYTKFYPEQDCGRLLNGGYYSLPPQTFNRRIPVDFGIVSDMSMSVQSRGVNLNYARIFLARFFDCENKKSLIYKKEELEIILENQKSLKAKWINDVSLQKSFQIVFLERNARTTIPDLWPVWQGTLKVPVYLQDTTEAFIILDGNNKLPIQLSVGGGDVIDLDGGNNIAVTLQDGSPAEIDTVAV